MRYLTKKVACVMGEDYISIFSYRAEQMPHDNYRWALFDSWLPPHYNRMSDFLASSHANLPRINGLTFLAGVDLSPEELLLLETMAVRPLGAIEDHPGLFVTEMPGCT